MQSMMNMKWNHMKQGERNDSFKNIQQTAHIAKNENIEKCLKS